MHLECNFLFKHASICLLTSILFIGFANNAFGAATKVQEGSVKDFSVEAPVPSSLAKSDLPLALRTLSAPVVTPRRTSQQATAYDRTILLGAAPLLTEEKEPALSPKLLPETDPEPGIVYIVPFTGVEAPKDFYEGVFDRFVDNLNHQSNKHGLQVVILKQGLRMVPPEHLQVRKYIKGELSSYVEDSNCCSTNIRTEVHITFHHPNKKTPVLDSVIPASKLFDHDQSSIEIERIKLTEEMATALSERLSSAFKASLVRKNANKTEDNGV